MGKLPPTEGALKQHFLRAALHANIWYMATSSKMSVLEPTEYGWMLDEEGYWPVGTMESVD